MNRWSRRSVLRAAAASIGTIAAVPLLARRSLGARRPNIVFLLADDLRYNAVGYLNKRVRTPNLDRLAAEGIRFHNAFVTTPICAVSRASIFTGMYARRHRLCDFTTPLSAELAQNSYPALLRMAGYRTGFFGKYGVGDGIASSGRLDDRPTIVERAGFDVIENYGFTYYVDDEAGKKRHIHAILAEKAECFIARCPKGQPFCLSLSFVSPHEQMSGNWIDEADPLPAERDMLADYSNEPVPVPPLMSERAFATLPAFVRHSMVRYLWEVTLRDPGKRLEYFRRYYALISGMDRVIGHVMKILRQQGELENTVVLFTSDNGYFMGDYGLSGKYLGYESSIRVPLVIRPPAGSAERDIYQPVLNIDLAPTMLSLGGAPTPSRMQGRDLTALWNGTRAESWRTDFLYEYFTWCQRVDGPKSQEKKYILPPHSEGVRNERYTYLRYPGEEQENEALFDRASDPSELVNIIRSAPRDLVEQMRRRTDQLIELNS